MFIKDKGQYVPVLACYVKQDGEYAKAESLSIKDDGEFLELFRDLKPAVATVYTSAQDEVQRNVAVQASFHSKHDSLLIDWGDGTAKTLLTAKQTSVTHLYKYSTTMHQLTMLGRCKDLAVSGRALRSIDDFGYHQNRSFGLYCTHTSEPSTNLEILPEVLPKHITHLDYMFSYTDSLVDRIEHWDVSHVVSMNATFTNARNIPDITLWDVSGVTSADSLFYNSTDFNQDLSLWYLPLINVRPVDFDANTPSWEKENRQPIFGSE